MIESGDENILCNCIIISLMSLKLLTIFFCVQLLTTSYFQICILFFKRIKCNWTLKLSESKPECHFAILVKYHEAISYKHCTFAVLIGQVWSESKQRTTTDIDNSSPIISSSQFCCKVTWIERATWLLIVVCETIDLFDLIYFRQYRPTEATRFTTQREGGTR